MEWWFTCLYVVLDAACAVSAVVLLASVISAVRGNVRRWRDRRRAERAWRRG